MGLDAERLPVQFAHGRAPEALAISASIRPIPACPAGLTMVAENEEYPFRGIALAAPVPGFGVNNRLNSVAVQIVASSSYTIDHRLPVNNARPYRPLRAA